MAKNLLWFLIFVGIKAMLRYESPFKNKFLRQSFKNLKKVLILYKSLITQNDIMKKWIFRLTNLAVLFTLSFSIFGQEYKYKKVSKELLQKTFCEIDPNAPAMITNKTGYRDIIYTETDGFRAELKQQTQVKFFKGDVKDIANIEIFYYSPKSSSGKVKMSGIKGKTYNLENNKIVETKLADDNIFHVQYNNYFKKATFIMPNIQDGSVFEYEFVLTSDYYTNIEDWIIQDDIPVIYNQFTSSIPEYFIYQINIMGGIAPTSDKMTQSTRLINYRVVHEGKITGRQVDNQTFNMNYSNRTIVYENIPSFESEPFVANKNDGKSRITHQLISVIFPNTPIKNYAGSYEKINLELLENESFGKVANDGKFIEKLVPFTNDETQSNKAMKIHQYFRENLRFDGYFSYSSLVNGSKLFKDGKGDVGDINLNYIAALNHAGIPTSPVILSTRGNGTLHPILPDYSQFNYVIAMSNIDGKSIFSDATSSVPFGNLPIRCLHDNGWVVSKTNPGWVNLKQNSSGKQIIQTDVTQTTDKLLYVCKINKLNYLAYEDINSINSGDKDNYIKTFDKEIDFVQDSILITEISDKVIKIKEHLNQHLNDDNIIYVKPFLHLPFKNNPFKQDVRESYVDFPYAMEYKFVTSIKILDGYKYEVPDNLNAVLQENDLLLKYSSSYISGINTLSIIADFKIIQTEFAPTDYEGLKATMETMINKLNEPIILKKI